MKRLYYLRHGQSVLNVAGLFAGSTDTELTDEGRRQALASGAENKDLSIDIVLCSPLRRAADTAKLFLEGAELPQELIELNPLLAERSYGSLENTPYEQSRSRAMLDDNLPEGVEPWSDVLKRARKILDYIEKLPVDNVLLVGHGGIGRAIRSLLNTESDIHAAIPNAELVRWI